jgi:hypothetical protein
MRFLTTTASLGLTALMALAASGGCSSHVSEGGSETNWLCSKDGDCKTGQRCVEQRCEAEGAMSVVMGQPDAGAGGGAGGAVATTGSGGSARGGVSSESPWTTQFSTVITTRSVAGAESNETGLCLPLTLDRDRATGQLPCSVVDVGAPGAACDPAAGLMPPSAKWVARVAAMLKERGSCDVSGKPSCSSFTFCAVPEAHGAALQSCLSETTLPLDAPSGFCYVDPDHGLGSAALADKCPGSEHQLLRFFPESGDHTFVIACFDSGGTPTSSSTPGTGKIGDPFVPQDESRPEFSGFSANEVNIESRSPSCESGVGLVYGFTGRVTCPYGQDSAPNDPTHADPAHQTCVTPGGDPVTVPVSAQSTNRRPSASVYCSCRCDGPDTNAAYCACPNGFECKPLVQDYGFGSNILAGSFCIKSGTDYTPGASSSMCDRVTENCGPP